MAEQLAKGTACILAVGDMLNEAECATEASWIQGLCKLPWFPLSL